MFSYLKSIFLKNPPKEKKTPNKVPKKLNIPEGMSFKDVQRNILMKKNKRHKHKRIDYVIVPEEKDSKTNKQRLYFDNAYNKVKHNSKPLTFTHKDTKYYNIKQCSG